MFTDWASLWVMEKEKRECDDNHALSGWRRSYRLSLALSCCDWHYFIAIILAGAARPLRLLRKSQLCSFCCLKLIGVASRH